MSDMHEEKKLDEKTTRIRANVDRLLKNEYTAFDTRNAMEEYGRYGERRAKRRVDYITELLGDENTTAQLKISKEEIERLKSVRTRGMSHLLLNERSRSDSPEMAEIKFRVGDLERMLYLEKDNPVTSEKYEQLEIAYQFAINACELYLNNPKKRENRRKAYVRQTFEALSNEANSLQEQREGLLDGKLEGKVFSDVLQLGSTSEKRIQFKKTPEEKQRGLDKKLVKIVRFFDYDFDPEEALLKAGSNETSKRMITEQYLAMRDALKSFPPGQVCLKDVTLLGTRVKLLQRSDGSLRLISGHQEYPLLNNAVMLSERIGQVYAPQEPTPYLDQLKRECDEISYQSNYYNSGEYKNNVPRADFERFGGASRHKVLPALDALRIEKKSGGLLAAVPCGKDGVRELRPSIPQYMKTTFRKVELRRTYNYVLKAIFSAMFDEKGNLKNDAGDIGDRLDDIFFGHYPSGWVKVGNKRIEEYFNPDKARQIMMELLLPEIKKSLRTTYDKQNRVKRVSDRSIEREAKRIIEDWILIQKKSKAPIYSNNEITLGRTIKELCLANRGDFGNWEKKARKLGATEDEILKLSQLNKKELADNIAKLKAIKDMDPEGKEVPLQNTCTANANFYQAVWLNCTGKLAAKVVFKVSAEKIKKDPAGTLELIMSHFDEYGDLLENPIDYTGDVPLKQRMIGYLKKLKADENLSPSEEKDYTNFVSKYASFEFHAAGKLYTDVDENDQTRIYTAEAFAREPWESFTVPFTLDGYVGEYKGKMQSDTEGKAESLPEMNDSAEVDQMLKDTSDNATKLMNNCRFIHEGMKEYYKKDTIFAETRIKQMNFLINKM